jgi:phosphohistidine phosphatase SixA
MQLDLKHILKSCMHGISNDYIRVMVVGHSPGVEELVQMLTGETHPMSTCSLAHIKLHVDRWLDMDYETKGQLAGICRPLDLSQCNMIIDAYVVIQV